MIVYAFEWCSCIYESGFGTMSLHTTRAGAYHAMRHYLVSEWIRETADTKWCYKLDAHDRESKRMWKKEPFKHNAWRVTPIEVHDD